MSERRPISTAPASDHDEMHPVLLWVRGAGDPPAKGRWIPGVVYEYAGGRRKAVPESHKGDLDVPFWAPFPADPE